MAPRDTGTEQLIKDTAKRVFFAEGKLHATTQDIANAAGVSRTLLHYYFRSKDLLISQVFKEAMHETGKRIEGVMASDVPFRNKIENMVDVFLSELIEYPYQETFLITEINSTDCVLYQENKQAQIKLFLNEIENEMNAGNIAQMNPIHFMMNLFSLMSYPLVMGPLYREFFKLSEKQYKSLVSERKELICNMIFK